jgi:hypothetical protein
MKLFVQALAWSLCKLNYIQAKFRLGERSEIYCKMFHVIVLRVIKTHRSLTGYRRFGGKYRFYFQGWNLFIPAYKSRIKVTELPEFLTREDGTDMFS